MRIPTHVSRRKTIVLLWELLGGCPASAACSSKNAGDWGGLPSTYATCGGIGN
jgi:hypothetical protein